MSTNNTKLIKLLGLSHRSPSQRPNFYRLLLKSDLLLLCKPEFAHSKSKSSNKSLKPSGFEIEEWQCENGERIFPIFSSAKTVQIGVHNADVLSVNAKQIFKSFAGCWFVLDPFSDLGKEFTPFEITQLLKGNLTKPVKEVRALKVSSLSNFKLKPFSKTNKALLKELADVCRASGKVHKAYIASVSQAKNRKAPILSILLKCKGQNKVLYTDLALTALEHLQAKQSQFVDVIPLSAVQEKEVSKLGIKPFFSRARK